MHAIGSLLSLGVRQARARNCSAILCSGTEKSSVNDWHNNGHNNDTSSSNVSESRLTICGSKYSKLHRAFDIYILGSGRYFEMTRVLVIDTDGLIRGLISSVDRCRCTLSRTIVPKTISHFHPQLPSCIYQSPSLDM